MPSRARTRGKGTDLFTASEKEPYMPTYFRAHQKGEAYVAFLIFIHPDILSLKTHNDVSIRIYYKKQCRETSSKVKPTSFLMPTHIILNPLKLTKKVPLCRASMSL